MKNFARKALILCLLLGCLLALSVLGASAASTGGLELTQGGSTQSFSTLAQAVNYYKQNNPSAAQHTITSNHKVVYADDTHWKDVVNAQNAYYSYYAYTGSDALKTRLSQLGVSVQLVSDSQSAANREILVGVVDRFEQSSFLPMVDANEYGIMVTDRAIILLAWQDAALKACVDMFKNYLSTSTLGLPVGFTAIGVADAKWKVDFVRPANTALTNAQYVNDDSLQFLYTGAGATHAGYLTYCQQLTSSGFTLSWQSTVGNNEFRMYKNAAKGIALYVAYNDYTYQAEFDALYRANYPASLNAYLPGSYEQCIRIVSSPLASVTLPDASVTSQQSYTKVTDSYMVTLGIYDGNVGTGHVFLLEDGRFVIIDGGNSSVVNGVDPAQMIWDVLLALYKKAYGAAAVPTAQRPIHVAAWYLTHAHSDHYNAFKKLITMINNDSSKKSVFKMDYMIANLPGEYSLFENTSTQWGYSAKNNENHVALQQKVSFRYLKVHTGQRLYFANLMIEVLMTFEDHLPYRIQNTNDTNTVTRFHIRSSGVAANTVVANLTGKAATVMFLGDSWRSASRYLCAMYGDYLRSDISQIAHHGNIGCEKELYQAISPIGVLFNNSLSMFKKYVWETSSSSNPESVHAYGVDRYVVRELNSVVYVWTAVAGTYTTLKFTVAGAQYEAAFDLLTGRTVTYIDVTRASSAQTGFAKNFSVCVEHIGATSCTESFTCSRCGTLVPALGHDFTGAWQKDTEGHWHVCARMGCGATQTKATHVPEADDGDCTTARTCSVCDAVLVAGASAHTGGTATCEIKARCTVCGKAYGAYKAHTPGADDGDCTTPITCTVCDAVTSAGASSHTGGTATCKQRARCRICGKSYGALANHSPDADDGDCTTPIICSVCHCVTAMGASAHTGGMATCESKARCETCGKEYGALAGHSPNADDGDCTTPITCAVCDTVLVAGASAHTGGSATSESRARCEACGKEYGDLAPHPNVESDTEGNASEQGMNTPADSAQQPKTEDEASVAVILVIVIGSLTAVALGVILYIILKKRHKTSQ